MLYVPSLPHQILNTYVRPIFEYCSVLWSPHLIKYIDEIESVQRRFTRCFAPLRELSYKERLRILQLESLEERRLRIDLICMHKCLLGLFGDNLKSCFKNFGHSYDTRKNVFAMDISHCEQKRC